MGWMPFLSLYQQCKDTERIQIRMLVKHKLNIVVLADDTETVQDTSSS